MKVLQILVLIFGLSVFANAQKIVLSGVIYDSQGAVVVGTNVKLTNEKGESFETKSNDEGIYSINLLPEIYKVSFEQSGFRKTIINNFKIVDSTYGKINHDVVLEGENPEPCGYSGADCLNSSPVETKDLKVSNKIYKRPVEKSQKKQNKTKRNNKQ